MIHSTLYFVNILLNTKRNPVSKRYGGFYERDLREMFEREFPLSQRGFVISIHVDVYILS